MLEKSDANIAEALAKFNKIGVDVALIVPTANGMQKSIMDATASIREYFRDVGIHVYDDQNKGQDSKVIKTAFFVWPDSLQETSASLYRPETKNGDPRIWFPKLKEYASPFNLLALVVHNGKIYVINCSRPEVLATLANPDTPLGSLMAALAPKPDSVASELLARIKDISSRGFIKTVRAGDTGVGATLEDLLGISANANKTPDYKGIEIKAKRLRKGRPNRVTLFSQVPDWKLSPIGSAWDLLSSYGYYRNGKLRLNHEMNAKAPNSLGFMLELDANRDWLKQNHVSKAANKHVVTWQMPKLRDRLIEKHPQTFWVSAKCQGAADMESFHYLQVEHTKSPKVRNFDTLIEGGVISVDYLMSEKNPGTVRDHGYLFKIHPQNFDALFPPSEKHFWG